MNGRIKFKVQWFRIPFALYIPDKWFGFCLETYIETEIYVPDHVGCRKIGHIHIRKSDFVLLTKSIPHYTPVEWNYICHLKRHFNKLISITTNDSYREHCKPFTRLVKIKIPNNPPIAYKLEPKSFNRGIDLFWFFQRWIHLPFFFLHFHFIS